MIITNHCKDPYEPTIISWKVVFFLRGSFEQWKNIDVYTGD